MYRCGMQNGPWIVDEMRRDVRRAMEQTLSGKLPSVHRSRQEGYILAVPIGFAASPEEIQACRENLEKQGYRIGKEGGWMLIDRPEPAFPDETHSCGGNLGSLVSVLSVHERTADAQWMRRLILAGDESEQKVQETAAALLAECAVRLRKHEALPDVLSLCHALGKRFRTAED